MKDDDDLIEEIDSLDIDARPPWFIGDPYPDDWVNADLLRLASSNPRRGKVERITASIKKNGWYLKPLLVQVRSPKQGGTTRILTGNHSCRAGLSLGMERFPVQWIECTDEQGDRILLIDNKAGDDAEWDEPDLAEMLQALDDVDGTGFTETDLDRLIAGDDTEDDEPGDTAGKKNGGGLGVADVPISVGPYAFTVSRNEWDHFEHDLKRMAGNDDTARIFEIRERLGL